MNSARRTCKAWTCRNLFSRVECTISVGRAASACFALVPGTTLLRRFCIFSPHLNFALEDSGLNPPFLLLLCGELEFTLDEVFDALIACQTQADERTLALQVDVKIKKRAAFAFGGGPIG